MTVTCGAVCSAVFGIVALDVVFNNKSKITSTVVNHKWYRSLFIRSSLLLDNKEMVNQKQYVIGRTEEICILSETRS